MVRLLAAAAHAVLLASASIGVFADVDCASNITIANADDAKELRDSCTTLEGNLILDHDLSETINLDGLEVIKGTIAHNGCDAFDTECQIPDPFNITSSTLREIHGSIDFWYFQGLQALVLPKLESVNGTVSLKRLHNVTHLDFTDLRWIGNFILETERLESLLLEGLEGFHDRGWGNGGVELWNAGKIESVDGFFKNAIDPMLRGFWTEGSGMYFYANTIPNVRTITFGWTRLPSLTFSGNDLTVILGGPNTTEQHFERLELRSGIKTLERGSAVKNLTVEQFDVTESDDIVHLTLAFDQATEVSIGPSNNLETLELPSEAKSWRNFDLYVAGSSSPKLNLTEYRDGRQVWYWPEETMERIWLSGNFTTKFV